MEMYFRNESRRAPWPLTLPGCPRRCPLQDFLRLTEPVVPQDWQQECRLASSPADTGDCCLPMLVGPRPILSPWPRPSRQPSRVGPPHCLSLDGSLSHPQAILHSPRWCPPVCITEEIKVREKTVSLSHQHVCQLTARLVSSPGMVDELLPKASPSICTQGPSLLTSTRSPPAPWFPLLGHCHRRIIQNSPATSPFHYSLVE